MTVETSLATPPQAHASISGRRPRHIAIIGAGIAGLSTAFYLQKKAAERNLPIHYTLLESSTHLGGKLLTEYTDGFTIEGGPDSFITQKPAALQLVDELGLNGELVTTQEQNKGVFVYQGGKLKALPDGVMLIVPTKMMPFATSTLFSPWGKVRMGMDLVLPARKDDGDETLADFIRRRLGNEALDRLAEPLMAGIYNAEAEDQSIMATFPRFRAIERKHGSLIKGMLAARSQRKTPQASNGAQPCTIFMSLRNGISDLAQALSASLTGEVWLNANVRTITSAENGFLLKLHDQRRLEVDQVVLATPAYTAAELVRSTLPELAEQLQQIRYVSTGTISMAYDRADIPHDLNGFGLVIPRSAGCQINAVTWTSQKWPQRAPAGKVLLRAFYGGSRKPEMLKLDDDALSAAVRSDLQKIMGVSAQPQLQRIYRWIDASPQYDVGHLERLEVLEQSCPSGLHLTGSAYKGVGIPDCIAQGAETADKVLDKIAELSA